MIKIMRRYRRLVNTDPARRCYYGCHASSSLIWSDWDEFDTAEDMEKAKERLKFWRELNDYAVKSRGESAMTEYRIEG